MSPTLPDSDECYFCEATDDLERHHIVPQRLGGTDGKYNLVTVCHDCHWKLERLYNKDFYKSLGITDSRTTKESHIPCEIRGCTNPATTVDKYVKDNEVIVDQTGRVPYRCEEHENEDEEKQTERIVEFLRENSHTSHTIQGLRNKLEMSITRYPDMRELEMKNLVKSVGGEWIIHPSQLE